MPVARDFVRRQLHALNPNKARGLDDISSLFLRDGSVSFVEPLSHIINTSIFTERVTLGFKQARVLPLFRKESKLDVGNYRPVNLRGLFMIIYQIIFKIGASIRFPWVFFYGYLPHWFVRLRKG